MVKWWLSEGKCLGLKVGDELVEGGKQIEFVCVVLIRKWMEYVVVMVGGELVWWNSQVC